MLEIVAASVLGLISKVKAHESCCSGDAGDAQQQEEEPWLSTLDIVVLGAAGKKISFFDLANMSMPIFTLFSNEKPDVKYLHNLSALFNVCIVLCYLMKIFHNFQGRIIFYFPALGTIYYFFLRKKPEEPSIKNYVIQPTTAPVSGSASMSKGFMDKMKKSMRRMVVFYGSQTGTAEEFAARLAKEGMRYGFRGVVADPEECEMEDLTELKDLEDDVGGPVLAVFCMATYGEGDPTDNAQAFFDWLQEGSATVNGK